MHSFLSFFGGKSAFFWFLPKRLRYRPLLADAVAWRWYRKQRRCRHSGPGSTVGGPAACSDDGADDTDAGPSVQNFADDGAFDDAQTRWSWQHWWWTCSTGIRTASICRTTHPTDPMGPGVREPTYRGLPVKTWQTAARTMVVHGRLDGSRA